MERPRLDIPPRLAAFRAAIHGMLEPCVELEAGDPGRGARPDGSRLFGRPFLHHVGDWPRNPEGRPLFFVAQVNLPELFASPPMAVVLSPALPPEGLLSFFYDLDALPAGTDPDDRYRFRVLWIPNTAGGKPIAAPPHSPEIGAAERPLRGLAGWRLPSEVDSRFSLEALDELSYIAYSGLAGSLAAGGEHRLFGHPDWLGPDARAGCAAATAGLWGVDVQRDDWRLLWQVGGEPELNNALGEEMRLYVLIRNDDLVARRFIRSWVILQTG